MDSLPDDQARDVIDALGKNWAYEIWSLLDEPTTVKQICEEHDFPRGTAHKQINRLVEAGLIEQSGRETTGEKGIRTSATWVRVRDRIEIRPSEGAEGVDVRARRSKGGTRSELMKEWRDQQDDVS